MAKYILTRLFRSLITLFIVVSIVFCLLRLMPVEGYFQNYDKLTESQIRSGLTKMGLNDPIQVQLANFYKNTFKGDLGVSNKFRRNVPITKIIAEKAPVSLKIGLMSITLALALGLPMGVLMARSTRTKYRIGDKLGTVFVVLVQAVPSAVYYLFIQVYGTDLFRLPLRFNINDLRTWILPVVSLALGNIAYYAMWLRRYMVDESNKDYVRLARAKGLSSGQISFRHTFRNAFVPLIQYLPSSLLFTLMGSLYVESLYSIPGMGGLLVDVIKRQDNTMVQALVLVYAGISILGLLVGDVLMAVVDPRISFSRKEGSR